MKRNFEDPTLEIQTFEVEDVVTTSGELGELPPDRD